MRNPTRLLPLLLICFFLQSCVSRMLPPTPEATLPPPTPTSTPAPTDTPTPTPPPTLTPEPSGTPEGTWIRITPDSGAPGTTVQVDGYLPGGLAQDLLNSYDYQTGSEICWNGCQNGLQISGSGTTWSRTDPGHFSFQFTVPLAPWLSTDGLHPLDAGDYSVDLINLDPSKYGCDKSGGCPVKVDASTTFRLTQSAASPACDAQNCGTLTVSPAKAAPGETVQVSGWAPLIRLIGTPIGYNLALAPTNATPTSQNIISFNINQALDGTLSGTFQVPQMTYQGSPLASGAYTLALDAGIGSEKGSPPVLINPIPFELAPAQSWSSLHLPAPLGIQPSADLQNLSLAADLLNPARMAYCAPGKIMLSEDSGKKWSSISTTAVKQVALPGPVAITEDQPQCVSVTLDSAHPNSLYAVFSPINKEWGAPPVYYAGYFTADRGKTWQLAPLPSVLTHDQAVEGNFGGFWTNGQVVQALYYTETYSDHFYDGRLAKETSDGGLTWYPAPLACPTSGPCLRWGSAPTMVGGMGTPLPQNVLFSQDSGKTWEDSGQQIELRMDGPHQLIAFSNTQAVLISGEESFPLRYSADGGKTWQALSLAPPPGGPVGLPYAYPGLQMLSDGTLLTMQPGSDQWLALPPSATDWCLLNLYSKDQMPVLFRQSGEQVWWLSYMTQQPQHAPESTFTCKK